MIITLTTYSKKIGVNTDYIVSIEEGDDCSYMAISDGQRIIVDESYDDIMSKITSTKVILKEGSK